MFYAIIINNYKHFKVTLSHNRPVVLHICLHTCIKKLEGRGLKTYNRLLDSYSAEIGRCLCHAACM